MLILFICLFDCLFGHPHGDHRDNAEHRRQELAAQGGVQGGVCYLGPWASSSAHAAPAFVFPALIELAAVDQRLIGAGPGAAGKHRRPSTQRGQYFIIRHHGDRLLSHLADALIEKGLC